MISSLLKIPYLRLKYKFLPNAAQAFWAQELFEAQGLGGKLGQVLAQGQKAKLPKSSLTTEQATSLFRKNFPNEKITFSGEVLAASMGQVFFGELGGKRLAVKLLHPGIKEKIKEEIGNILLLGSYFAKTKGFRFDKEVFGRFLSEVFEEETDLVREAQFQLKFRKNVEGDARFVVPDVYQALSNHEILTQEFVASTLARDLETLPHFNIFHFFFNALFKHHVLHGDLNDRNWGLNEKKQTVIYDFGCAQVISERRIQGLIKLLLNVDVVN
jgi:predicted unusual protein kinase regulating ubiquinone biosynthesis (AarF/ABC1/UbiB family)